MFDADLFLKNLTHQPGIYQMLDKSGETLYVGKARDLKKRVTSYFQKRLNNPKTQRLMELTTNVEVIVTASETEALLLESNLIKQLKPRYNVLLRDDKSYPYIFLSAHADYPRIDIYRGSRKEKGRYFGPYPSANAVHISLNLLQKLFKVRQCRDSFFRNRSRPCLQYQIKRCSAPCVNFIAKERYQEDVRHTELFLEGKNQQVINELKKQMELAAEQLNFELAVRYRDQIKGLQQVQETQHISKGDTAADVVAVVRRQEMVGIGVVTLRGGRVIGGKNYFPATPKGTSDQELLEAFFSQYYLNAAHTQDIPPKIYLNSAVGELSWLVEALSNIAQHKVIALKPQRGEALRWLKLAEQNVQQALATRLTEKTVMQKRFQALAETLQLPQIPQRIECFDVSHTLGEATIAACVAYDVTGPRKEYYRRFNIKDIQAGDDYAAMRQALSRHYLRLKTAEVGLPEILLIDGGKGQLTQARIVLEELQITDIILLGISKGPQRKAEFDTIWLHDNQPAFHIKENTTAFHLLQEIRDEAHRFAITGHRLQRAKARKTSVLEEIPGIGANRRRALLQHFGGLQGIKGASAEELAKISGISRALAERIYEMLHG